MILFSLRVCINGLNCDYLSKPNTEPIKGIFVIIIFLSHIRTYADFSHWTDLLVIDVLKLFRTAHGGNVPVLFRIWNIRII